MRTAAGGALAPPVHRSQRGGALTPTEQSEFDQLRALREEVMATDRENLKPCADWLSLRLGRAVRLCKHGVFPHREVLRLLTSPA
jgi:hypothetical protein